MKVKVSEQSIKHLVDNDCIDMVVEYIRKLESENAGLRAEVERLEANTTKLCTHGDAEIARLKAEVERLKEFISKIPAEARIKVLTEAHKGCWDGCPPSDEYIRQLREGGQP